MSAPGAGFLSSMTSPVAEGQAEGGQSCPVEGAARVSTSVAIASAPRTRALRPPQGRRTKWAILRSTMGRSTGKRLPLGAGLLGAGPARSASWGWTDDGAPAARRRALAAQRAVLAVGFERGLALAVAAEVDGHGVAGGAGDGVASEVDVEAVLGEPPVALRTGGTLAVTSKPGFVQGRAGGAVGVGRVAEDLGLVLVVGVARPAGR